MSARFQFLATAFGLTLCMAPGCASTSPESMLLRQKEQEIRALEDESSRRAGALATSQKVVESLRSELRALSAEKSRVSEDLARRQTELEYHEEKARALEQSQRGLQDELTRSSAEILELRRNVALASRRLEHVSESVLKTRDATRVPEWVLAEGVPEVRVPLVTLAAVHEELRGAQSSLEPITAFLRSAAGDAGALVDEPEGLKPEVEVVEATMLSPLVPPATSTATERSRLGEAGTLLLEPGESSRGRTFLAQLLGIVRHHFLRLFESGRKWDAGDYGFLGVLLLTFVLLSTLVLVPVRWVLQRPKERELALLRRVVASGSRGDGAPPLRETDEETEEPTPETEEQESCTIIVEPEDSEVDEPLDDEEVALRPVEPVEPSREERREATEEEVVPCGPPPRTETDSLELASTQELDRLTDDDLERTREFSRELDGEATEASSPDGRETTTPSDDEEFSDEVAHALDTALPQEKVGRSPPKAAAPRNVGRSRAHDDASPSAAPSLGETQGLESLVPEEMAQTQEMPRLPHERLRPVAAERPSLREDARQTRSVSREVLPDGATTQPIEPWAPEDSDATRELDPRAYEQFRTTQRVPRGSGDEPSSTQEVRRERLEERASRPAERHEIELRLTQDISLKPSDRPTATPPKPASASRPVAPRPDETAPLPGLITTEFAATQPLPEVLFRSPEPKAPPTPTKRPPDPSPPKAPPKAPSEEAHSGEERSLLSQLERLMGRKVERDRG